MTVTIDGTTGVSLVQDGVVTAADLASGAVSADKLASTLDLTGKTVTLPSGVGGKVINKYSDDYTGQNSLTSGAGTGYYDTGLDLSITPTSASSVFLILATLNSVYAESGGNTSVHYRLERQINGAGYSTIYQGGNGWVAYTASTSASGVGTASINYIDSPATTSQVDYKVRFKNENASTTCGFNGSGTRSEIIILELTS